MPGHPSFYHLVAVRVVMLQVGHRLRDRTMDILAHLEPPKQWLGRKLQKPAQRQYYPTHETLDSNLPLHFLNSARTW